MAVADLVRGVAWERIDRRTMAGAALAAVAAVMVLVLTRPAPSFPVLVAATDLPAGVPLDQLDLEVRNVTSAEGLVEGIDAGELDGWTLSHPVAAGEPLLPSLLRAPELVATPDLFAIALDPEHAALGRIVQGDRVDVYVTWRASAGASPITEMLASSVYVVEARAADDGPAGTGNVELLLAVDDQLAGRLAAAVRTGELDLVRKAR